MIKTVSLETAKLLNENGFSQELNPGDWYWFISPHTGKERLLLLNEDEDLPYKQYTIYKSITTDELLEELPFRIKIKGEKQWRILTIAKFPGIYRVHYLDNKTMGQAFDNDLPAALAQMWLWLKKEGLIE